VLLLLPPQFRVRLSSESIIHIPESCCFLLLLLLLLLLFHLAPLSSAPDESLEEL
jgi:hypothetical protein